jgi:hypothetical protein
MFIKVVVQLGASATTASPATAEAIGKLPTLAPRYGIKVLVPVARQ